MSKSKINLYSYLRDFLRWLIVSDYYMNFFAGIFGAIAFALVFNLKGQLCKLDDIICWTRYSIVVVIVVFTFFIGAIIIYAYYKVNKKANNIKISKTQKNIEKNKIASKENKTLNFFKKNLPWIVPTILTILITIFVSNEIIHPLFKPRVSEFKTEPLFIQYIEGNYYIVTKLVYTIDVPLFPTFPLLGSYYLKLKAPERVSVNTQFKEVNPYIEELTFNESVQNFKEVGKFYIKLNTHDTSLKTLSKVYYVAQKLDKDRFANRAVVGASDNYFWNDLTISPILECMVAKEYESEIAYLRFYNQLFTLNRYLIKNNCDLEVKGYKIKDYGLYCDGDISLKEADGERSLDLKPRELKKLLVIKSDNQPRIYNHTLVLNLSNSPNSDAGCLFLWNDYKKYFKE